MKCPICGGSSRVLATRHDDTTLTTRRARACIEFSHTFSSLEIHDSVMTIRNHRIATVAKTIASAVERWRRDVRISNELHGGWQPLAEKYGLTKSAIYLVASRVRSNLRLARKPGTNRLETAKKILHKNQQILVDATTTMHKNQARQQHRSP